MRNPKREAALWSAGIGHPDKAIVGDIDPDNEGLEILFGVEVWHDKRGVCLVDADNLRELPVYGSERGKWSLGKYKAETVADGFEGSIMMIADLFGDWREEIVTVKNGELRVYTSTIPAKDRRVSLIQDPLYRSYIYNRSMGYTQSPMVTKNF